MRNHARDESSHETKFNFCYEKYLKTFCKIITFFTFLVLESFMFVACTSISQASRLPLSVLEQIMLILSRLLKPSFRRMLEEKGKFLFIMQKSTFWWLNEPSKSLKPFELTSAHLENNAMSVLLLDSKSNPPFSPSVFLKPSF